MAAIAQAEAELEKPAPRPQRRPTRRASPSKSEKKSAPRGGKYEKKLAKENAKAAAAAGHPEEEEEDEQRGRRPGRAMEVLREPLEEVPRWRQAREGGRTDHLLNPYPHKFSIDMSLPAYRAAYSDKSRTEQRTSRPQCRWRGSSATYEAPGNSYSSCSREMERPFR